MAARLLARTGTRIYRLPNTNGIGVARLDRDKLGLSLFITATAICVIVAVLVTYVYRLDWFRERLLSEDRWRRAEGMLPIAFPVYIWAGLIFSYFRR